jgi:plastocyanin
MPTRATGQRDPIDEIPEREEPMSTRRSIAVLSACLVLPLSLAACGDDDDETTAAQQQTTATQGGAASTVAVSESEYKLDPANPTVKAGEVTIEVSNDGSTTHALEVEGPGEESQTEDIASGDSAKLTVDLSEPGTYEWYCPIANHKELGMEGEIRVAGASGSAPPADDSGGDEDSDSSGSGGSAY